MFTLLHVALLTCGLGASLLNQSLPYEKSNDSEYQLKYDNHKNVVYNDNNYSVTFTAYELNNYHWDNLAEWFNELGQDASYLENTNIVYQNNTYSYSELVSFEYLDYGYRDNGIDYYLTLNLEDNYLFSTYYATADDTIDSIFDNSITINLNNDLYDGFKNSIELDYIANQPYIFDDNNYQITISADYLNNVYFKNLANYYVDHKNELDTNLATTTMVYDSTTAPYHISNSDNWLFGYELRQAHYILLASKDLANPTNRYKLIYEIPSHTWEYSLQWNLNASTYASIKKYISKDFFAYENQTGTQIIGAIESGLGLVPDLATEFLTGFTNLFWNTTNEELTSFGIFACVFLGIAITMAVIALCLNILRRNTGA